MDICAKFDHSNGSANSRKLKAPHKQNFMEVQDSEKEIQPPPQSRFDHDRNALSEQESARYLAKLGTRCNKIS